MTHGVEAASTRGAGHCLEVDVLVAGGGTAGSAAAVAAARRGHRVLLVEEANCLGGTSTTGGVGEWFASLEGLGNIFDSIVRMVDAYDARCRNRRHFNQEYVKAAWQQIAERAGVQLLFHASVSSARRNGRSVSEVGLVACSQPIRVQAKQFVDATGEGDLGALAGAAFLQGDPLEGRVLHLSLTAWMYDTGRPRAPCLPEGVDPILTEDDLPGLGAGWIVDEGRIYMNATKVMDCDPTDPFDLSRAECEARRQLMRVVHYLNTHGYPTYALASSGARIGIREGRRLVGDFVLGREGVLDASRREAFDDVVAVATSQVDFHSLTRSGHAGWRQRLDPYGIPFRCLVARDFSNLLMAGKCISVDQVVLSSCRMTPTCCALGQAAGTAAALALEQGAHDVREVPTSLLRSILSADGMELDPARHKAFSLSETRVGDHEVGL